MQIAKVKISNILGIEEFSFSAGKLNLVKGANGEGKSSLLSALVGALGSGSQAKLLRNGTDKGEIVLLFEEGIKFRAKVSEKGIEREAWDKDNIPIPRIQTWLRERFDAVAFNPVKFLRGTPAERLEWLLTITPLHLSAAKLKEACPEAELLASSIDREGEIKDPLKVIAALDTQMRERRTLVGREAKKKKGFADELEGTLPGGSVGEDSSKLLADIRQQYNEVLSARQVLEKKIDVAEAGLLNKASMLLAVKESELKTQAQAAIDRISAQLISDLSAAREAAEVDRQSIRDEAKGARKDQLGALQTQENLLATEVSRLQEVVKQQEKSTTTRALLKQARTEADEHKGRYEALSASIEKLEEVRTGLFAEMPITGLEVKDGAILVDGIDYETLNGANQVRVAFQLAKAASPGGLVALDGGLSELDDKHRRYFEEWAEKSGLQFFLSEVAPDGTPLTVETAR